MKIKWDQQGATEIDGTENKNAYPVLARMMVKHCELHNIAIVTHWTERWTHEAEITEQILTAVRDEAFRYTSHISAHIAAATAAMNKDKDKREQIQELCVYAMFSMVDPVERAMDINAFSKRAWDKYNGIEVSSPMRSNQFRAHVDCLVHKILETVLCQDSRTINTTKRGTNHADSKLYRDRLCRKNGHWKNCAVLGGRAYTGNRGHIR